MKKKLQLVLSAIFMALTGLTAYGQEPRLNEEFAQSGITYKVTSTSPNPYEVEVVGNTNTGDVVIPSVVVNVQNWKITSIGDYAFNRGQLTSIDIPEGVTHIGEGAFGDNSINSVVIPTTVTSIGKTAFWNNRIASLEIPEGIAEIRDNTFGRNELASVTLPASVTSIGNGAFITHPNSPSKMTELIMLGSTPPTLQSNSFTIREEIHVTVPAGAVADYEAHSDWIDFKSITEPAEINGTFTDNHITYRITSLVPYEVTAIDYNTQGGTEVDIPETVDHGPNTYTVTSIGVLAFYKNQLTSVTIPHGTIDILYGAFAENQLQGHLVIPNSVTTIGGFAFEGNQLTRVDIPETVTSIGHAAFRGNQLTEITLPSTLTHIGAESFSFNQLTRVTIPDGVISIGDQAFAVNPLDLVTVEATVPPTLGATVFYENDRHQIDVVVPSGTRQAYEDAGWTGFKSVTEVAQVGGTFIADHITYQITSFAPYEVTAIRYDTQGGTVVDIPETVDHGPNTYTVTAIGPDAFHGKGLTGVTIPETVTSIGVLAFYRNQLTSVTIPHGTIDILYGAFAENQLQGHLVIPNSVTTIGGFAFEGNQLTRVDIPETVTSIGLAAFRGNNLTEVTIPGSVPDIGGEAFSHNQLTRVTIRDGVTSIGDQAFAVNPLDLVTVEAAVPPTLGATVFYENDRHQIDVVVPSGTRQAYEDAGWTGFKSVTEVAQVGGTFIADHITYQITSFAPYEVTAIRYDTQGGTVVDIPETVDHGPNTYTVTAIGPDAFHGKGLTGVTIPETVTSIGVLAFYKNQLTSVTIPHGTIDILYGAFAENQLQGHLVIPNSVTTIGGFAFEGNQLTRVDIPETVTSIGLAAFRGNNLTEVTIPGSVPDIGGEAFSHNQLTRVTIRDGVTSIGYQAFAVNPLDLVIVEAAVPPTLGATVFYENDRHQIDLVVPSGTRQAYLDNGWTGFKSISEKIGVSIDAPAETINLSSFTATIRFDVEVTGFTMDDIDLVNAIVNQFIGSGSTYIVEIRPISCNGSVQIDVPENVTDMRNLPATATVAVIEDPNQLVAAAKDITVQLDASGRATILPEDVDDGSAYGCTNVPNLSLDIDTFDCSDVGTPVTVTLTATQGSETATATALVTVEESPLVANAKDIIVGLGANGQATILPENVDDGSAYGCDGTPELSLDIDTFDCSDVGTPVTVTLTATAGNQTDISTAVVTVENTINSLVAVAQDIIVQLNADGMASVGPDEIDNGSGSGCNNTGPISLSLDRNAFTCDDVGMATVVLTARQGSETATATATVTVEANGNCGTLPTRPDPALVSDFNRGVSPNGDGIGDTLVIEGLEAYGNNVVMIYDLGQRLLFRGHYGGPGDAWDGTDRNGLVPVGSYVCIIDYNEPGLGHEARMIYVNY